jgi:hypothetical protein
VSYDIFICHASEDKNAFVRALAKNLVQAGLRVWYDEFSLKVGDSLRQAIDKGLRESRYGVVVLSKAFFAKKWPQAELDGLFEKETLNKKVIIPVWYGVVHEEVKEAYPILAGRVAALGNEGLNRVVERILDVIDPDNVHKTIGGQTIYVSPSTAVLHSGEWAIKTPILVVNKGHRPLHSVWVKLKIADGGIVAESIITDISPSSTSLKGIAGPISFSADMQINAIDSLGFESVFIVFHTIAPFSSREFVISGSLATASHVTVEIASFEMTPVNLSEKKGKGAISFKPPENLKIKGVSVMMRRGIG